MPPSDYRELSLSTIDQLDQGLIKALFDEQIRHTLQDCDNRPNDKSKRTVTLKVVFIPIPDATGTRCVDVGVTCLVDSAIPKEHSRVYMMPVRAGKDTRGRDRISAAFLPVDDRNAEHSEVE